MRHKGRNHEAFEAAERPSVSMNGINIRLIFDPTTFRLTSRCDLHPTASGSRCASYVGTTSQSTVNRSAAAHREVANFRQRSREEWTDKCAQIIRRHTTPTYHNSHRPQCYSQNRTCSPFSSFPSSYSSSLLYPSLPYPPRAT